MRKGTFFGCLLLATAFCSAQESASYRACNRRASTQHDMNVCAHAEAERSDKALNRVYRLLLDTVHDNPVATEKIRTAEKAWSAYRDAYLEAMFPAEDKPAEYGSMFPMELDLLRASLTRQQIKALQNILRENQPQ
jgi:uncharacterized protein YecT (DUF1311 family)